MAAEADTLLPSRKKNNKKEILLIGSAIVVVVVLTIVVIVVFTAPSDNDFESPLQPQLERGTRSSPLTLSPAGGATLEKANNFPCDDGGYSKRTLKKAYELPFASLFTIQRGKKKYEASDVIIVDGFSYAVCDNSWAISKFDTKLEPFLDTNIQLGDPSREKEDSGYEAIFYDPQETDFYVVRESVLHEDETYHAVIEQLELGATDYTIKQACSSEFEFEGDSKGFEGAIHVRDVDGSLVILGLCEGNYCSQSRKGERGNGRLVAMRRVTFDNGECHWNTIRKIKLPESAYFKDYSAITMDEKGRVAISSQEDSQLWVGQLLGQKTSGLWDVDQIEFDQDVSRIFDFPKNSNCECIYCNIEGVHWINPEMIMAVSDKMKSKGKQDFKCFDKDQSVHVFVLP